MAKWGYWDWIGYAVLGVAAIIEAINTSLRAAPDLSANLPSFLTGGIIGYLPLLFFVVATLILVLRAFGYLPSRKTGKQNSPEILEPVENRVFFRERVIIDGKKFTGCTFNEVKLIYNGEPYLMQHCKFGSGLTIGSDKDSIEAFVVLLHELGFLAFPVHNPEGNVIMRNTKGSPSHPIDD